MAENQLTKPFHMSTMLHGISKIEIGPLEKRDTEGLQSYIVRDITIHLSGEDSYCLTLFGSNKGDLDIVFSG